MRVFNSADFLLPEKKYLDTWPVIACDQFTSEKEYWERAEAIVGKKPSALKLIYPEVYLSEHMQERIADINCEMQKVLSEKVLQSFPDCFVYIERTLKNGSVRRGLLGVIDLEAYSFLPDADTPVRATEKTVPERIPPRVRIREHAPMELSHVLMFCDDPEDSLLGPLEKGKDELPLLYDLDLMLDGGRIRGYMISNQDAEAVRSRIDAYEAMRAARTPVHPVLYLVGDGNHSLATAKTCYETLKANHAEKEVLDKARYAMVELGNVQDASFAFEPIHRLLTGIEPEKIMEDIREICSEEGYAVRWYSGDRQGVIQLNPALGQLPVGILQNWLDKEISLTEGVIDYIHGEESLHTLAQKPCSLGFELPPIGKHAFFDAIEKDGVLPRKTFSIGHAQEKRYYLEARLIR